MNWCAETDQRRFDSGTLLTVYSQPWGPDVPPSSLIAGNNILVRFTAGSTFELIVVGVQPAEMIVQTTDGTKWKMREPSAQQKVMAVRGPDGAHASHWLVTERLR